MPHRVAALAVRYLARVGFLLLAMALGAAIVRFQVVDPQLRPLRLAALAIGLALGAWRVRYGILFLVVSAPLLGVIPRIAGVADLSLPEHVLVPLLVCGGVHWLWVRTARPQTAVDAPLAVYLALVALSAGRALWQYWDLGLPLWDIAAPQLNRHFSFAIWDYTKGPFLVVHYSIVAVEGAVWFVLLTASGTRLRAGSLRAALILSAIVVALGGVAQSIWHIDLIPFFERMQPGLSRINSTLPDPNTLGSFLVLLFPLGLVAALSRARGRWLAIGWTGLLGYCLVRSVSRSAWVGAGTAALATAVLAGWRAEVLGIELPDRLTRWVRRAVVLAIPTAVGAVLLVSLGVVGWKVSYGSARSPLDMVVFTLDVRRPMNELMPSRADHWEAAIKIWEDFPLFGAGVGKYVLLKNRYLPEARQRWLFFCEAHNYYLKILSELGVVGLIAFVVVLGSIGVQVRRGWQASDLAGRRRVAALALGLLGFLVTSFSQDPLTLREMQYIFWAVVALLVLETREATGARTCGQQP